MDGWKKLVAGALIGVAGTIYATDEEARRNLPRAARDLPDSVRRRFKSAVSAGREASSERRLEILRDLEGHGGGGGVGHRPRRDGAEPQPPQDAEPAEPAAGEPVPEGVSEGRSPDAPDDATEPIDPKEALGGEGRREGA